MLRNGNKKMDTLARLLEVNLEIQEEKKILQSLGLTNEEIDGYIEFFADNWFGDIEPEGEIH